MSGWLLWAPIIVEHGFPFADKLFALIVSGKQPTPEDWAELRRLSRGTPESQMMAAFARAGIDPASPQAQELLRLIPKG